MTPLPKMKLGRRALKRDTRTLRLARYLGASLPPAPPSCDWTKTTADFGVMLNDQLGDCTIAGAAHAVQIWTLNSGSIETLSDPQVLNTYVAWDGYVPGNPDTDNGGIELDVLNKWRKLGLCGHSLIGFAAANVGNITEMRQGIALFGGAYIGMEVPNFIMESELDPTVPWDLPAGGDDGGIDGGHCVYVVGYDAHYFYFISWGKVYKMTVAFFLKYVDEGYVLFGGDWVNTGGKAPSGFLVAELTADLVLIH